MTGSRESATVPTPMSRSRMIVVFLMAASLILGSNSWLGGTNEIWPFSTFPMFTVLRHDSFMMIRHYGVPEEPGAPEINMMRYDYLQPYHPDCMYVWFRIIEPRENAGPVFDAAAGEVLRRYHKLRAAGRLGGPPLRGVRVVQLEWDELRPDGINVRQPDRRKVLGEAWVSSPEAGP